MLFVSTALAGVPIDNIDSRNAGSGGGDWSNPGNVVGAPDNNCANMGAVGKANLTYNFGFNIPGDATITGVVAHIKAGENAGQDIGVQLGSDASNDPPTVIGTQQVISVAGVGNGNCASTQVAQYGSNLASWGLGSLTPAVVNTSTFGMVFTKIQTSSIKVDSICMEILYTTNDGDATTLQCFQEPPPDTNQIRVVKTVVGTAPATEWDFSGSEPIGNFALAASGGFEVFTDLADGSYTFLENAKPGYTVTSECFIDDVSVATGDDEITVAVAEGEAAICDFTNTLNTASFTVNKTYDDGNTDAVDINLVCDDGDVTTNDLSAAPGSPAVFEVTGFDGDPNCTATESGVPQGYTADNLDCSAVALLADGECTIDNTLNTASFTVNKTYDDGNTDPVTINLVCDDGDVTDNDLSASPINGAKFEVTGFDGDPNCTATESGVPQGYTADNSDCSNVALLADGECTIANTVNVGSFTVRKIFSDDSDASVSVTATCTAPAIVTNSPQPASQAGSAIFNVERVDDSTTCTASEAIPDGYEADLSDCQDNDPINGGCTIVNNRIADARFHVIKDFSDDNPGSVKVFIDCNTGLILDQEKTITEAKDVTFVVTSYDVGELTCKIFEKPVPSGYSESYTATVLEDGVVGDTSEVGGCEFIEVIAGHFECEIFNELQPVVVTVNKEWIGPYEENTISREAWADYSCSNVRTTPKGSTQTVNGGLYFNGDSFDTIEGIYPDFDGSSSCSVTELDVSSEVEPDDSDCKNVPVSLGQGGSCTIYNVLFFEGIPTLSNYGLAVLAMLMLGVGFVGFRRFT